MEIQLQVSKTLSGDSKEFEPLVLRYQKPIFKYLYGIGVPHLVIEDVAQDIFLLAFSKLETFDSSKSQFSTWLFSIARHQAINHFRKKKLKSFFGFNNEALEVEKTENLLFNQLQNEDQRKLVFRYLQKLPAEYRSCFSLYFYNDLSLDQISIIENCSLGTVKSRLHRAKSELKSLLPQEAL